LQVLRNLLSNAVKFSPEGGRIDIELQQEPGSVKVSLRDQGIGIPEDELEAVFDKFIQSSKTKTGAGGTGLGLAICQEIVVGHRGRIWAENNPGGGARLNFVVPTGARRSDSAGSDTEGVGTANPWVAS
jgi:signal transduction histidine kinase